MTASPPDTLEQLVRRIVRETVRDVVREELAVASHRNVAGALSDDGYLSVAKAARTADVATGTIRAWIRAGRLTAKHAGRVLRVSRAELEQFMRSGGTVPHRGTFGAFASATRRTIS
jgi:excisionase family DNA binding protein